MLVFIHINKTGGNTVSHILRSSYGLRHCQVEPWHARWTGPPFCSQDLRRLRKYYPYLKSIAGHRITGYSDLQESNTEFKYFTFIRDPLKSCASRFQYKVQVSGKKNLVFEDWIQQDWTRNHQTNWIAGVDDVEKAIRIIHDKKIFVGLTERFDESLVMLKALIANDLNISYKKVNVARNNSIKKRLLTNQSMRQLLIDSQKADLQLYDYVQNELYPTYQREYGSTLNEDVSQFRGEQNNNFNYLNLSLCRFKHYLLYKPSLDFYRFFNK